MSCHSTRFPKGPQVPTHPASGPGDNDHELLQFSEIRLTQTSTMRRFRFNYQGMSSINTERVREVFAQNFLQRGELGASLSIWENGVEILTLTDGYCDRQKTVPWTESTLTLLWSATKGPAAACVLHALQENGRTLETRVSDVWPEFAAVGKQAITFGEILSHRAGLAALEEDQSVFDHEAVVQALARQNSIKGLSLSGGHGYHPRTFGFLLDELVRKLTKGLSLSAYWQQIFAQPLGLDLWIGLPQNLIDRVSPVLAPRSAPPKDAFMEAFSDPNSLTFRAFNTPRGLETVRSMNSQEAQMGSFPGFGGIGNAKSLAKFYAMLANGGELDGTRYFNETTLNWMSTTLTDGPDAVLQIETAFSAGFMKDPIDADGQKKRSIFGPSLRAFGQPGAGGSVGFADPERGIAFAYVMNQMESGVLPGEKAMSLIEAL